MVDLTMYDVTIQKDRFILSETWFLLNGIIQHLGIKPWEKLENNGTTKIKTTKTLHFWFRYCVVMVLFFLINIAGNYLFLYEVDLEDYVTIFWYINESIFDLVTGIAGQITFTLLTIFFLLKMNLLANEIVKAQDNFNLFILQESSLMKKYFQKIFAHIFGYVYKLALCCYMKFSFFSL